MGLKGRQRRRPQHERNAACDFLKSVAGSTFELGLSTLVYFVDFR
jgi:hypothetical protein